MSRKRSLSTQIAVDKSINRVALKHGDWPVLLFTWLIPHALDDTFLPTSDPEELLFMVFPGRRDKTAEDMEQAIDALVSEGLLLRGDGTLRFKPKSFYAYQTGIPKDRRCQDTEAIKESERETPQRGTSSTEQHATAQNATEQHTVLKRGHNGAEQHEVAQDATPCHDAPESAPCLMLNSPTGGSINLRRKGRQVKVEYSDEFEQMWSGYPRKIEKAKAYRAWQARIREGYDAAAMTAAVDNYRTATLGRDPTYIKHAATFFGPDKPFLDYAHGIPADAAGAGDKTLDELDDWANGGGSS